MKRLTLSLLAAAFLLGTAVAGSAQPYGGGRYYDDPTPAYRGQYRDRYETTTDIAGDTGPATAVAIMQVRSEAAGGLGTAARRTTRFKTGSVSRTSEVTAAAGAPGTVARRTTQFKVASACPTAARELLQRQAPSRHAGPTLPPDTTLEGNFGGGGTLRRRLEPTGQVVSSRAPRRWRKRVGVEPTKDRLAAPPGFEVRTPHRGRFSSAVVAARRRRTRNRSSRAC